MRKMLTLIALLLMVSISALAQIAAVPQLMHFHGRLTKPDGTPVPNGAYSVRFSLWTALTGGTEKWNQTQNVTVRNGTFSTQLNVSTGAADKFNNNLFLEIKIGNNAPLTPRQQLTSVAYAMKANSVKDGAITGAAIANGTITAEKFAGNLFNPIAWLLNGNSSPAPDSFLGTLTNFPLELRTNNRRAMEYRYADNTTTAGQEYRSINVLGGSSVNEIEFGVIGATIAGGGKDFFSLGDGPNRVTSEFGTIGGGFLNLAGGPAAVVAGGEANSATSSQSTVAGGQSNTASGQLSSVLGGYGNIASGLAATVAGGFRNAATATVSFAAGNNAKALHTGSFVWSDSQLGDFASTGANQFMVRAGGGIFLLSGFVGIGTNAPQGALHIKGFQGALNLEGTSQHVYMQFFPRGFAAGRKAYIGFASAGTHDLTIANEDGGAVQVVGTFVNNSDRRWKTNVAGLDHALDSILRLRGVSYDWRQDLPDQHFTQQRQIGFLAQEVEEVLPELVYTNEKGYKSVAYVNVVPVLVEAVKTLKAQKDAEIQALKADNTSIRAENAELKARLDALAAAVEELKNRR